jgi:hydroxymethylbilane synthase
MNATLAGGCQAPVAGYSELKGEVLEMRGLVGRTDGSEIISGRVRGVPRDAVVLGRQLADDLLSRGARTVLEELLGDA